MTTETINIHHSMDNNKNITKILIVKHALKFRLKVENVKNLDYFDPFFKAVTGIQMCIINLDLSDLASTKLSRSRFGF